MAGVVPDSNSQTLRGVVGWLRRWPAVLEDGLLDLDRVCLNLVVRYYLPG